MVSVIALTIFLAALALLAAVVVLYAAYTYRGLSIPKLSWLDHHANQANAAVTRRLGGPLENTAAAGALVNHGVVLDEGKDTDLRNRFWQAERRVVSKLPHSQRRRYEQRLENASDTASTKFESKSLLGDSAVAITGEHKVALV